MLYDECGIGMNLVIRLFSVRRNKYYLLYFYILICACARETLTAKKERERGGEREDTNFFERSYQNTH